MSSSCTRTHDSNEALRKSAQGLVLDGAIKRDSRGNITAENAEAAPMIHRSKVEESKPF